MKTRSLLIAASMILSVSAVNNVFAQDGKAVESDDVSSLFASMEMETSPSTSASPSASRNAGPMTAAELRQARAQYRSSQRIARLESNLWMGHEPLRPNWGATPMTSSRYSPRRTYYVPVYYYGR